MVCISIFALWDPHNLAKIPKRIFRTNLQNHRLLLFLLIFFIVPHFYCPLNLSDTVTSPSSPLMISWGIILPFVHWRVYQNPRTGSPYKPTRIKWNDRGILNTAHMSSRWSTEKCHKVFLGWYFEDCFAQSSGFKSILGILERLLS